jgi:hypothetical protein
MSELEEGVDGDEDEGDLDLGDREEDIEEENGSVYNEVLDYRRRVLQRFSGGDVEGLVASLLSKEEGVTQLVTKRSRELALILQYGWVVSPCDHQVQNLHGEISIRKAQ